VFAPGFNLFWSRCTFCPVMCLYVLISVLGCPLWFPPKKDALFVLTTHHRCFLKRPCFVDCGCLFSKSGVEHVLTIRVTWRLSYKIQELLTLREFLDSPPVFGVIHVAHLLVFCGFLCLLPMSCVPNTGSVSRLSIFYLHVSYLQRLFMGLTTIFNKMMLSKQCYECHSDISRLKRF